MTNTLPSLSLRRGAATFPTEVPLTYTDVYVGELSEGDNPLDWGGVHGVGNEPKKDVTPLFPFAPGLGVYEPFSTVRLRILDGTYKGEQIDWGGWAAVVTKTQIVALLEELYGPPHPEADAAIAALHKAVQALDGERRYALTAVEF